MKNPATCKVLMNKANNLSAYFIDGTLEMITGDTDVVWLEGARNSIKKENMLIGVKLLDPAFHKDIMENTNVE